MKNTFGLALVSASAALTLTFVSTSFVDPGLIGPGAIREGDVARYTWRTPLVNGMGVTSIEDLRGKPVLFDFWGTR